MLRIQQISLTRFKNYDTAQFAFDRVTGICGPNGVGKTNLLDAVYYCCLTRSYFSHSDQQVAASGSEGFRLEGIFELDGETKNVVCIHRGTGKKEILLDGVPYEKFSKHIGLLPVVMIAPDDSELITGGSEIRRKFLDALMCQCDPYFLEHLIQYNKILRQRNSLLRQESPSKEVLDVLDIQMITHGKPLFEKRKQFMETLIPLARKAYKEIATSKEDISIDYESALLRDDYSKLLEASRPKDLMLQRSTCGIHRDELDLTMNGLPFRQIASQGQRKSLLFALKLAEFETLRAQKGFAPLLLLDDVFEKLDDSRMQNLLHMVCSENDGQVIITDTHRDRLESAITRLGLSNLIIELK
jgi:DNA replication and repair protein RecF